MGGPCRENRENRADNHVRNHRDCDEVEDTRSRCQMRLKESQKENQVGFNEPEKETEERALQPGQANGFTCRDGRCVRRIAAPRVFPSAHGIHESAER